MRVVGKPEVIQLDEKSPMLRLARPALQRLLPPGRAAFSGDFAGIHLDGKHKKTGQICLREKPSVSDLESSSLAGIFAIIRSNLCTRP